MFKKTFNQFQNLFNKLRNAPPVKQAKKHEPYKRAYGVTGALSWLGFVPPSTMRKFHRGISGAKPINGAKECARRVAQGNAGYCYNKEAELRNASWDRCKHKRGTPENAMLKLALSSTYGVYGGVSLNES
jgi:hypothetical protein